MVQSCSGLHDWGVTELAFLLAVSCYQAKQGTLEVSFSPPFRLCQRRQRILLEWLKMSMGTEEQASVQQVKGELDQVQTEVLSILLHGSMLNLPISRMADSERSEQKTNLLSL